MSETQKELDRYEALQTLWEGLVKSEGFRQLEAIFRQQEMMRRNAILLDSTKGLDGLIHRDQLLSELKGINTVLSYPSLLLKECEMQLPLLREQLQQEIEGNNNE